MLTPEVTKQLPESWQGPYSVERAASWIRDRDAEGTQLLALSSSTREPVALLLLHEEESALADRPEVRIGYLVSERQWGRGFASELLFGLIDWARASGVASIVAGVAPGNGASIRVLEKCGLTRVERRSPTGSELFYGTNL
jgi:RimJ/RimL family protein N-acetyltransferase